MVPGTNHDESGDGYFSSRIRFGGGGDAAPSAESFGEEATAVGRGSFRKEADLLDGESTAESPCNGARRNRWVRGGRYHYELSYFNLRN